MKLLTKPKLSGWHHGTQALNCQLLIANWNLVLKKTKKTLFLPQHDAF